MRAVLLRTGLAIATTAAVVAPASAQARGPSGRRVRAAVSRAEHSRSLWATINVCKDENGGQGGTLGVRGQMPALGFSSTLTMTTQLNTWSPSAKRFVTLRGAHASQRVSPGSFSRGLHQDGAEFSFTSNPGLLDASITFTWTRGGKALGRTTLRTRAGHRDADYGNPPHYSAAQCRIG